MTIHARRSVLAATLLLIAGAVWVGCGGAAATAIVDRDAGTGIEADGGSAGDAATDSAASSGDSGAMADGAPESGSSKDSGRDDSVGSDSGAGDGEGPEGSAPEASVDSGGGDSSVPDAGQDAGNCVGSVDVVVDNGALEHWTFECAGELYANQYSSPIGYLYTSNGSGQHGLKLVACRSAALNSEGMALYVDSAAGVGAYMAGTPKYTDGSGGLFGKSWDPFDVVVTAFGPEGQPIEGTLAVSPSKNNASHTLSGSFHVCRAVDYVGP